ncbi:MAG: transporter [Geobacteraceae bacterium]
MFKKRFAVFFCWATIVYAATAVADEGPREIQDNSFLIEEAYNQEDGVIQHIQAFSLYKGGSWAYTFTQEWPVPGQTHQLSYTIPVERTVEDGRGKTGIGDVALNYRYQAVLKDNFAFAPRFSVLLPTGDYKRGLGSGTVGYQINLPLSVKLSDRFVTHYNLGMTFTPNSKDQVGGKADTFSTNYGASVIYLASKNLNLMLEAAGSSDQVVAGPGRTDNENSFFINPGLRYAFDCKVKGIDVLQIVPGISFPIGVGPSKGEYGILAYLSIEHSLF